MKQVALITGGTRGIGLGIARVLASRGFDLALNGVREEAEVMDTIMELRREGSNVIYCQGNLASKSARNWLWKEVMVQYRKLNLLVNNAGMAPRERMDLLEATEESFHEVMEVNLTGPYFLTQHAANHMIIEKQYNPDFPAAIINISSVSATQVSTNRGEYCISKAGMAMMTQLYAVRLGEYNIPVYEIRPGITQTDMTKNVKAKYDKMIEEGLTVQKRWATPEDIGKAVAALAGGEFPYSTGQVINVDGGMTIGRL